MATIALDSGIIGQLRASEISRDRVEDARTVLKVGETVEARLTGVDRKTRIISLSIKAKEAHEEAAGATELQDRCGATDDGHDARRFAQGEDDSGVSPREPVPAWESVVMTKSELIESIARSQKHLPAKDVELAVKHILELMSEALASGERIEIRGFGSFSLHYRPPRMGRNPKTGEAVALAGKNVPHFKPGKDLRERVNESRHLPVRD